MKTATNNLTTKSSIRDNVKYSYVPEGEQWRLGIGQDMLGVSDGKCVLEGFTKDEINDILTFICVS